MAILARAADTVYAFRFLKLLVTPFNKTKAYELGIIDDKGKVLIKSKDRTAKEQKDAYTFFYRLVFNIKKLIPAGRLGSYAAALLLLREHTNLSEDEIMKIIEEYTDIQDLNEDNDYLMTDFEELIPGTFILRQDTISPKTGEVIALKGSKVVTESITAPVGRFAGINIYEVKHKLTNQNIYVTRSNIER